MDITEIEKSGQLFDGWQVVRFIGEGGYGKVYEIKREGYGVSVNAALKHICIPKNSSEVNELMSEGMDEHSASMYLRSYVEEFSKECEIMSRLKGNSHIVSFEDYKVIENKETIGWDILIRMEMLTPLIQYMKNHTLSRDEILDMGISICDALELCKKQNIMHRDIKPANIFVSANGDFKLGDFGISRIVAKSNGASTKVGTPDYMAPEVYKGDSYDNSVDIYSLGIVLYRFFNNNRLPFLPTENDAAITYSHREEAIARRMRGEALPMPVNGDKELYRILTKAAAYMPSERYQEPSELKNELLKLKSVNDESIVDDFEDEKTIVKPMPPTPPTPPVPPAPPTPPVQPAKKTKGVKTAAGVIAAVIGIPVIVVVLVVLLVIIRGASSLNRAGNSSASTTQTASTAQTTAASNENTGFSQTTEVSSADNNTTTDNATKTTDTADLLDGELMLPGNCVMEGDTLNMQFMAGDTLIWYSSELEFTVENESVAKVRRSSNGEGLVLEGLAPGNTKISVSDGTYGDTQIIRVLEKDTDTMLELSGGTTNGYLDYTYYLNHFYLSGDNLDRNGLKVPIYGETSISFDLFGCFNDFGVDLKENGGSVYVYSSETIRTNNSPYVSDGVWCVEVKDATAAPVKGDITIIITDRADAKVIWATKIPVEIVN